MDSPSILIKPSQDRQPHYLAARFKIDPYPSRARIEVEKVRLAERFVEDMRKQGWDYAGQGFKLTGPFPYVEPITIHMPKALTAKQMAPMIANGAKFQDDGGTIAPMMPKLMESECWEFQIAGVFSRSDLFTETPDSHEERR